ncbi:MAG: hypothetical protein ACM32O_15700 [Clostridia bacterium]
MKRPQWYHGAEAWIWSILAAIVVSVAIWVTGELSATDIQSATVPPSQVTPTTPAPSPAQASLFSRLNQEHSYSIHVREDNELWIYQPNEAVFFYTSAPEISFQFSTMTHAKEEELDLLRQGVTVKTATGKIVPFHASWDNGAPGEQVIIALTDAPQENLNIMLSSPDGKEQKIVPLSFTKPFTYTVHSKQEERVKTAFELTPEIMLPIYLDLASSHSYHLTFSLPVERSSVEQRLKEQLGKGVTGFNWESDTELEMVFKPLAEQGNQPVSIALRDIRSKQGYPLHTHQTIGFIPTEMKQYEWFNPVTNKKHGLFQTVEQYESVQFSFDGNWMLGGYRVENVHGSELMYTLLNRQGEIVKHFGFREMLQPSWLPDQTILYMQQDGASGTRQTNRYHPVSGQSSLFWKPDPILEKNKRVLSVATDPTSGRIAIAYGQHDDGGLFTYDIRSYRNVNDAKPLVHPNVGTFVCMEGSCLSGIHFLSEGKLLYSRLEEVEDIYQAKAEIFLLDVKTGQTQKWPQPEGHDKQNVETRLLSGGGKPTMAFIAALPNGKEKWYLYQTDQDHVRPLETQLSFNQNDQIVFFSVGKERYVFQLKNHGWLELNTKTNHIQPAAYIPEQVTVLEGNHPNGLIWSIPTTRN